jgi:pimeloyl-ACP methyl ester carboxylesterase
MGLRSPRGKVTTDPEVTVNVPASDVLKVPGASLYHEVSGEGPVLVFIAGGSTDAGVFGAVAALLADAYTVVAYDPRGNSRSPLDGPAEDQRIEIHAEDARRLIEKVAVGPVYVFGSSSGAIAGLELVTRHPELVHRLIAHEPPAIRLLADASAEEAFFAEIQEVYRRDGADAAMERFAVGAGMPDVAPPPGVELPAPVVEMLDRIGRNSGFFLEHEMLQFTGFGGLDVPALKALAARIVLACGADSREHLPARPVRALAADFGTGLVEFPGGHLGYLTHPVEFATRLREVLAAG